MFGFFLLTQTVAIFFSPPSWKSMLLGQTLIIIGLGIVIGTIFLFFYKKTKTKNKNREKKTNRVLVSIGNLAVLGFLSLFGWKILVTNLNLNFILIEGGYYLILFFTGFLLNYFVKADKDWSLALPFLYLFVFALTETVFFILNPQNQYLLGPEIVLFSLGRYAGMQSMLPLDMSVCFGGWVLAQRVINKKNP